MTRPRKRRQPASIGHGFSNPKVCRCGAVYDAVNGAPCHADPLPAAQLPEKSADESCVVYGLTRSTPGEWAAKGH